MASTRGVRGGAGSGAGALLQAWLAGHRERPYPTRTEKAALAFATRLSLAQISTWFANARRRLKKEEMTKLVAGGEEKVTTAPNLTPLRWSIKFAGEFTVTTWVSARFVCMPIRHVCEIVRAWLGNMCGCLFYWLSQALNWISKVHHWIILWPNKLSSCQKPIGYLATVSSNLERRKCVEVQ